MSEKLIWLYLIMKLFLSVNTSQIWDGFNPYNVIICLIVHMLHYNLMCIECTVGYLFSNVQWWFCLWKCPVWKCLQSTLHFDCSMFYLILWVSSHLISDKHCLMCLLGSVRERLRYWWPPLLRIQCSCQQTLHPKHQMLSLGQSFIHLFI